jgi:hypothetical protein
LGNTATPEYQRQAALGDDVGGFLAAEMLPIIVGLIDDIVAYAGIIEQSGSHTALCQTYPGNGSTGTKIFSWTDENSSGDIDLGDTVEVSFSSCWNNNPNNDHDTFYEGKIHFTDYLKAANPGGNSASVLLESFIITETELDNGAYTIDSDSAMTLTGGFDFTLTP